MNELLLTMLITLIAPKETFYAPWLEDDGEIFAFTTHESKAKSFGTVDEALQVLRELSLFNQQMNAATEAAKHDKRHPDYNKEG